MGEEEYSSMIKEAFDSLDLYQILHITNTASIEDINKAYRKKALKLHPDKGGNEEHFKALCVVHSILSDPNKRKEYDRCGLLSTEDISYNFTNWYEYYRQLFPKVTTEDIDGFQRKYVGSQEEYDDIVKQYELGKGSLSHIMDSVMFAEEGEEMRIISIIDKAISDGVIKSLPKYIASKNSISISKKPKKKPKKADGSADAKEEAELMASIMANRRKRSSFIDDIAEKYDDCNAKKKSRTSKGKK